MIKIIQHLITTFGESKWQNGIYVDYQSVKTQSIF